MQASSALRNGTSSSAHACDARPMREPTQASPREQTAQDMGQLILILDDDQDVRTALEELFISVGMRTAGFSSVHEVLSSEDLERAGCIIADVRLPGSSGLALQADLANRSEAPPIIFLTGHGDIQMAVAAIRIGAVDFLTKPVRDQTLLDAVNNALDIGARRKCEARRVKVERERLAALSKREAQVFYEVVRGRLNKQIAHDLGVSEATVKLHRSNVMRKMDAASTAELFFVWTSLPAEMRGCRQ